MGGNRTIGGIGGTDGVGELIDAGGDSGFSPASERDLGGGSSAEPCCRAPASKGRWEQKPDRWWLEGHQIGDDSVSIASDQVCSGAAVHGCKLSVACGAIAGSCFVSFIEGGVETYAEHGETLSGMFVKLAGPHSARHFPLPPALIAGSGSDGELARALSPVHLWVDCVPPGGVVLLALVGVASEAVGPALASLVELGVPSTPPLAPFRAFAAVGSRPAVAVNGRRPASGHYPRHQVLVSERAAETWYATHASVDVAYASLPLRSTAMA